MSESGYLCECKDCECPSGVPFDEWEIGIRICRDCGAGYHYRADAPKPEERTMTRLTLEMNLRQGIFAMAENCPDAIPILAEGSERGGAIDPDDAFASLGWGCIMDLDMLGIYGRRIVNLYDGCGKDAVLMKAVLRAYQLGGLAGIDAERVQREAEDESGQLRFDKDVVLAAVRARLPNFAAVGGGPES